MLLLDEPLTGLDITSAKTKEPNKTKSIHTYQDQQDKHQY